MLGLIIEKNTEEICKYLGVEFCSDLPLLTNDFLDFQLNELKSIGVNKFLFLGKKKDKYTDLINFAENINSLKKLLNETDEEMILLTLSNIFFQFKQANIDLFASELSSISLKADNGELCSVLLNKSCLLSYLREENDVENLWEMILSENYNSVTFAGFATTIRNSFDYKGLLRLFLDGKVNTILPTVAKGIYSSGDLPKGDFVIIPPVFFGDNVQIETDCVIGPYTVIGNNCLVAEKTYIKSSVLMHDVYISRGCFVDNSICGEGSTVRRDVAIFDSCILGKGVTVAEGTLIENNSRIRPFTNISEYKNQSLNYKVNDSCAGFCGYSPEKAALLGGAVGMVYENAKIGILSNKEFNAEVLKYAVVSGLMSTGVKCFDFGYGFLSSFLFYLNFCEMDYGVYINGEENGTKIYIINKSSYILPQDDFYSIKDKMLKGDITRCTKDNIKQIHQIRGMKQIYIRNLIENINSPLNVNPVFKCSNKIIEELCKLALSRLKYKDVKNDIVFLINENGTTCECEFNNRKISYTKLRDFVSYCGADIIKTDENIWRNDAVFLCFCVLELLSECTFDFHEKIDNLPSFFVAEKVFEINKKISYFASKLSESNKVNLKDNELFSEDDLRFKIVENGNFNKLKVLAKSYKAETAKELIEGVEKLLKNIDCFDY